MTICPVAGCDREIKTAGLCGRHYQLKRLYGDPLGGPYNGPPERRFFKFVNKDTPNGCWLWTGSRKGPRTYEYGKFWSGNGIVASHRWSYEHHHGPIAHGMFVMHTCDTPLCVNPDHLKLGTPLENMRDMHAKGRAKPGRKQGEAHRSARLTADDVRFMRAHPEISHAGLARKHGVDPNSIIQARTGRTWKHIT